MRRNAFRSQPKDMGSEAPLLSHSQYGEVISAGLLKNRFHRVRGLFDHQPSAPPGRFGKLLGECILYLLFHTRVDPSGANNM